MDSQQMVISNLPVWTMWVVAIAQIIFAIATLVIALVLLKLVGQLVETTKELNRHLPSMLNDVGGTLTNVKSMSDDAQGTVKHVTTSANHVSNVVASVVTRMESPLVKSVGMAAGVAAGAKSFFGSKKKDKDTQKTGGGRFGFGKKK